MVYQLFLSVVDYVFYYQGVKFLMVYGDEVVGLVGIFINLEFLDGCRLLKGICDFVVLDNFFQVVGIYVNCFCFRDVG